MRRFYVHPQALTSHSAILDQEESHHLSRVLRLKEGDEIELFDGTGALYSGTIDQIDKQVTVNPVAQLKSPVKQHGGSVIVCQGDLKGGKMDFLVEKFTELGVERFIPFSAGRSQGRIDEARRTQRLQRRLSIVKKACKQSGRLRFMPVNEELGFKELLEINFGARHLKLMLWERAEGAKLADAIGGRTDVLVCLMIGPEGGFSDEEAFLAQSFGWLPISLGNKILRSETAAIAAVAITNQLLGRM